MQLRDERCVNEPGPHGTLTLAEGGTRLTRLIETLGPAKSGKFFNYDGR